MKMSKALVSIEHASSYENVRKLDTAVDAYARGDITAVTWREIVELWMRGAPTEAYDALIPMSETKRVLTYVEKNFPVGTFEIAEALDMSRKRVSMAVARLKSRGKVTTHSRTKERGTTVRVRQD